MGQRAGGSLIIAAKKLIEPTRLRSSLCGGHGATVAPWINTCAGTTKGRKEGAVAE
jgi:hypothetical protein